MYLLISHSFKNPDKDYSGFFSIIESFQEHIQIMNNVWIVKTSQDADSLAALLQSKINKEDTFLIIEVTPEKDLAGWLPSNVVSWFSNNFK